MSVTPLLDGRFVEAFRRDGFVVVPDAEADAEKVMAAVQSLKGKP